MSTVDSLGPWEKFWVEKDSNAGTYSLETDHYTYISTRNIGADAPV